MGSIYGHEWLASLRWSISGPYVVHIHDIVLLGVNDLYLTVFHCPVTLTVIPTVI